jgi:hypothetical protein
MQKEYTLTEIKKVCANAKLTITNINELSVSAINTRNGMQHIFKIKQLDVEEELKKAPNTRLLREIKVNDVIKKPEDIIEEKQMAQVAKDEKERILQSFNELHKKAKFKDKSTMSIANDEDDGYKLPITREDLVQTEYDQEVNDFAKEVDNKQEPAGKVLLGVDEKKKILITPKTGKKRGRKPGMKLNKTTGKMVPAEELNSERE